MNYCFYVNLKKMRPIEIVKKDTETMALKLWIIKNELYFLSLCNSFLRISFSTPLIDVDSVSSHENVHQISKRYDNASLRYHRKTSDTLGSGDECSIFLTHRV